MEKIILASGSPRRRAILKQLHFPFRIIKPDIREDEYRAQNAVDLVQVLAEKKVENAAARLKEPDRRWILGVDTLVICGEQIFGKPQDRAGAAEMLQALAGRVHQVISGIALLPGPGSGISSRVVGSEVKFRNLSGGEIAFYLDTGEWRGVAGAYRIQERAALFIEEIKGSYSNIVGLPISVFYVMLRENKYNFIK